MKKLLTCLFLLISGITFGQTPMYISPAGSGANSFPFNTSTSNKIEWIYYASEFTPVLGAGTIFKLYFYTSSTATTTFTNLQIKMGYTTQANTVSGNFTTTGFTTVLDAPTITVTPTNGMVEFNLTTPFFYNGTDNLLIQASQTAYTGGFTVQNNSSGGNRRLYGGVASATGTAGSGLAQMGIDMGYLSDMGVDSIYTMTSDFCSNDSQMVRARIRNYAAFLVDTVEVQWTLDGVAQPSIMYTGPTIGNIVSPVSTADIDLGMIFFPDQTPRVIRAWTHMPNNVADEVNNNDTLSDSVSAVKLGVYVSLPGDTSICEGSSLTLDAGTFPNSPTYIWNNGVVTQLNTVQDAGTYIVTVFNADGCEDSDTIIVETSPLPIGNSLGVVDGGGGNFTFTVMGAQNVDTYEWDMGNGTAPVQAGNSYTFNFSEPGTYTVTVVLSNECGSVTLTRLVVISPTGIYETAKGNGIIVAPNPANSVVHINNSGQLKIEQISVISLDGRRVYQSTGQVNKSLDIDVAAWPAGIYQMSVLTDKGTLSQKLSVVH